MNGGVPTLSVVVATHNRLARLKLLLDSLQNQTLAPSRFEVIVVNDGSQDGTLAYLDSAGELPFELNVIDRPRASGPAAARNAGWRVARAPWVAFTDDDCEPAPDWLENLAGAAARAEEETFVQGLTLPNPRESASAGPFSRTLEVRELGPFYPTCNIAYPVVLLEQLGGFDESYPAPGGEDTDLAWRALELGAHPVLETRALVHHAVNEYGPIGKLRWALHWSDAMQVFGRHPGLRRQVLSWHLFWKKSHAWLLLALLGLGLALMFPPAALAALPYAWHLARRCRAEGTGLYFAPYLAIYDLVETAATARGAIRHRVLVL